MTRELAGHLSQDSVGSDEALPIACDSGTVLCVCYVSDAVLVFHIAIDESPEGSIFEELISKAWEPGVLS